MAKEVGRVSFPPDAAGSGLIVKMTDRAAKDRLAEALKQAA
jgi:hypothetical protein